MNNIADVIPVLLLLSAGVALIAGLGLTSFELIASRLSGNKGYQPLRQAPLARRSNLVLVQHQADAPAASANAENIKAAA
jgi:hypothetical protein